MKPRVAAISLLLHLFQLHRFVTGDMTDEEIKEDITSILDQRRGSAEARGRTIAPRKRLPEGDVFREASSDLRTLTCGESYSIAEEGFIFLRPVSKAEACDIHFVGSKVEKCTVGFFCDGYVTMSGEYDSGGFCNKGYMILRDGTDGIKSGCGSFSFKDIPRISRNNGADLFIQYKGTSDAKCLAFCVEDLAVGSRPKLKTPSKLAKMGSYKRQESSSCMCGKRRDLGRVVGGENALKFEFPWIGAITYKNRIYERKPICGGTLISDQYFVSAAHCFGRARASDIHVTLHAHLMHKKGTIFGDPADRPEFSTLVSGWDLPEATDEEEHSIRLEIEEVKIHPKYEAASWDYDVAILKFKNPLNFTKVGSRVYPICLPTVETAIKLNDGDTMVVAGWGRLTERKRGSSSSDALPSARILQKLNVGFINSDKCRKLDAIAKRHICAGDLAGGQDACEGDSGGPLITMLNKSKNQYFLAGIVSAGVGCARPNHPGWYTNVQEIVQWIYKHTDKSSVWCHR